MTLRALRRACRADDASPRWQPRGCALALRRATASARRSRAARTSARSSCRSRFIRKATRVCQVRRRASARRHRRRRRRSRSSIDVGDGAHAQVTHARRREVVSQRRARSAHAARRRRRRRRRARSNGCRKARSCSTARAPTARCAFELARRRDAHRLGRRRASAGTRSGERFAQRPLAPAHRHRARRCTDLERARRRSQAAAAMLASPAGLNGAPVFGTFVAVSPALDDAVARRCRARHAAARRGRGHAPAATCSSRAIAAPRATRRSAISRALWTRAAPALAGPRGRRRRASGRT